jgi:plasmid stabilization system protein ParE
MAKIVWSKFGLDSFHEHLLFIEETSLQNARTVAKKIISSIDMLESFPKLGRIVPEFEQEEFRELIVYQYRIVYRIKNIETIEIVSIYHSKQLLNLEIRNNL